jgi:hypothetical protein
MYASFDLGVMHSFVANIIMKRLGVEKRFIISTLLGKTINIDYVYKGVRVSITERELKAYLIPLELYNFDLILKMDWLGTYRAQMDCFSKIVTL